MFDAAVGRLTARAVSAGAHWDPSRLLLQIFAQRWTSTMKSFIQASRARGRSGILDDHRSRVINAAAGKSGLQVRARG